MWEPLAEEQDVRVEVVDRGGAAGRRQCPGRSTRSSTTTSTTPSPLRRPPSTVEVVVDASTASVTRVHVLDRGPGLSDEQLAHAFERFWRAADADHDGSGIGLAIVAHLAATSGGTVALQRRPGGGLDASVTLPRPPAESPRPAVAQRQSSGRSSQFVALGPVRHKR